MVDVTLYWLKCTLSLYNVDKRFTRLKWNVFATWVALEWWGIPKKPYLYVDYRNPIEFWKGALASKWGQFIISLAFGAAIRGWVNQILVLRRAIKTSRSTARCFDDSTQRDDLFCWTAGRAAESQWNRKWLSFGGSSTFLKNFHIFLFRMKFGRKNI